MNTRILAVAAAIAPLCISCSTMSGVFGSSDGGPEQVDDLLTRIEHVHAESQLAQQSMRAAISGLHGMVASDFDGDPLAAYEDFLVRIEDSEERAKEMRSTVSDMKSAAGPFFSTWSAKLNSFANPEMRARSQQRLSETHDRYQNILHAVEPALADHDALNAGLKDQALFLEHDFNANSVALLQNDTRTLTSLAATLDQRLTATRTATRDYVETSSLHGQLPVVKSDDDAKTDG